ncbi:MAG: hypothetical protein PWQ12_480 [Clostridiales bacterium]|jgi:diguanylate cyclase (GGDEF)-like protein|nr:hypothetical protein [Clostridiales bacterium]
MEITEINLINDQVENQEGLSGSEKLTMMQALYDRIEAIKEPAVLARILYNYGAALYYNGNTERAYQMALDAYKMADEHDLDDIKMKVCNLLGSINSGMSRHALGLDYYHQALQLAIARGNTALKGSLINNIAILYSLMKMYDRARAYFLESQELSQKDYNYFNYFMTTHNLLDLALEQNEKDRVVFHYEEAKEVYTLKKDLHRYKGTWHLIEAKYYRAIGDYDAALEKLEETMNAFLVDDDGNGISEAHLEKAKNYLGKGDFEAACAVCVTVAEESREKGNYELERESLKLYLTIQKQLLSDQVLKDPDRMAIRLIELDDLLLKNLFEVSVYQIEENLEVELRRESRERSDRLIENMRFIYEISKELSSEQDYHALIKLIIEKLKSFVSFDALVIGLYDPERALIYDRVAYHNDKIENSFEVSVENKSSLAAWVIRHNRDIYTGRNSHLAIDDFEPVQMNFPGMKIPYETVYYAPLVVEQSIIGVFSLQKYEVNGLDSYQIEMLRAIASYVAIAINNALKTQKMQLLNEELANQSRRDGLSGLLNRRALNDDLMHLVSIGKEDALSLATIMCDIDYFKEFNDYYGHVEGDDVIRQVSEVLMHSAEDMTPYVYRYGGDEFLMLFIGKDEEAVHSVGINILNGVKQRNIQHLEKGIEGMVTVSIGIAFFDALIDEDDVLKGADTALYASKRKGRNRVRAIHF